MFFYIKQILILQYIFYKIIKTFLKIGLITRIIKYWYIIVWQPRVWWKSKKTNSQLQNKIRASKIKGNWQKKCNITQKRNSRNFEIKNWIKKYRKKRKINELIWCRRGHKNKIFDKFSDKIYKWKVRIKWSDR